MPPELRLSYVNSLARASTVSLPMFRGRTKQQIHPFLLRLSYARQAEADGIDDLSRGSGGDGAIEEAYWHRSGPCRSRY
jgi:hypothetical protein